MESRNRRKRRRATASSRYQRRIPGARSRAHRAPLEGSLEGSEEKFDGALLGCYDRSAGWSSLVARWAHNPKVGGSNPPPATNFFNRLQPFGPERSAHFSLILPAIARQPARARPVSGHSRLGCIRSWSWRCWNAARVPAAPSHRCGSHVAGKNTSAGTCASPQS